jgi:hypothetical protein
MPWECDDIPYSNQQRGRGGYTLCPECNQYTGLNYARDFVEASRQAVNGDYARHIMGGKGAEIDLIGLHPLRFVKQLLAMFASINGPGLFDKNTDFRRLVMDKEAVGLDPSKYALYIYYLKGGLGRVTGISAILNMSIQGGQTHCVSELSTSPFGFILEFNPNRDNHPNYGAEITSMFNDYDYHAKTNIGLKIPVFEQNTPFPCDFRSKEEIISDSKANA